MKSLTSAVEALLLTMVRSYLMEILIRPLPAIVFSIVRTMYKHISELLALVETNLKVRYRQTFVGFVWVILNPIVLYSVQAVLFSQILKKSDSSYYFYLLSGLLPWFFLSQTTQMGCTYIYSNAGLIKNLKIHPFKLIVSLAIENYINLIASSLIIFSFIFANSNESFLSLGIYLLASLCILIHVTLITFISALLNALFRDTNYILHFVFTVFYFMTPTFFYPENLPPQLAGYLKINPFYWIISLFRIRNFSADSINIIAINVLLILIVSGISWYLWIRLKSKIYLKL